MKKIIITALIAAAAYGVFRWADQNIDQLNEKGTELLALWDKTEALIDTAPRGIVPPSCSAARSHANQLRDLQADKVKFRLSEKREAQKALAYGAKDCVTELLAANR